MPSSCFGSRLRAVDWRSSAFGSLDVAFLDPVPQLVDGQPRAVAFRPR